MDEHLRTYPMVCVIKGFEEVHSADYFSNAPEMQGGFNFEFLNVASALERADEALHTERARIISEIWISLRCSTHNRSQKNLCKIQNFQVAGT